MLYLNRLPLVPRRMERPQSSLMNRGIFCRFELVTTGIASDRSGVNERRKTEGGSTSACTQRLSP